MQSVSLRMSLIVLTTLVLVNCGKRSDSSALDEGSVAVVHDAAAHALCDAESDSGEDSE
jgi:hypothetical protein